MFKRFGTGCEYYLFAHISCFSAPKGFFVTSAASLDGFQDLVRRVIGQRRRGGEATGSVLLSSLTDNTAPGGKIRPLPYSTGCQPCRHVERMQSREQQKTVRDHLCAPPKVRAWRPRSAPAFQCPRRCRVSYHHRTAPPIYEEDSHSTTIFHRWRRSPPESPATLPVVLFYFPSETAWWASCSTEPLAAVEESRRGDQQHIRQARGEPLSFGVVPGLFSGEVPPAALRPEKRQQSSWRRVGEPAVALVGGTCWQDVPGPDAPRRQLA